MRVPAASEALAAQSPTRGASSCASSPSRWAAALCAKTASGTSTVALRFGVDERPQRPWHGHPGMDRASQSGMAPPHTSSNPAPRNRTSVIHHLGAISGIWLIISSLRLLRTTRAPLAVATTAPFTASSTRSRGTSDWRRPTELG